MPATYAPEDYGQVSSKAIRRSQRRARRRELEKQIERARESKSNPPAEGAE